jgi:hypothetical protein
VLQEAVDRFEELGGSDPEVTFAKIALVLPLILGGEPDRAADLLAECRALCHAHGDRWWLGHVLTASAHAAMALGDLAQAGAYVRQALQVRRDLDDPLGVAAALERLAWLAVMDHECARAARLLGAADRQWRVIGQRMYGGAQWRRDHDECENRARRALGETQFNTWFHRGARLPLAEAVADALNG